MSKKYELTNESITKCGITLYRIKAIKDFSDVKKGELGGYVQSEENLSQEGSCWIYDDAKAYHDAIIKDNAVIKNIAIISDQAEICGNAIIKDCSEIVGNAQIRDKAHIWGHALISGNAIIEGQTKVGECVKICGNTRVSGNSFINGMVSIENTAIIDNAWIRNGYIRIFEDAIICGNMYRPVCIEGEAEIGKNAIIEKITDYATVRGLGEEHILTTFFRRRNNEIGVISGFFRGNSLDEFRKHIKETTRGEIMEEYLTITDLMEKHFKKVNKETDING